MATEIQPDEPAAPVEGGGDPLVSSAARRRDRRVDVGRGLSPRAREAVCEDEAEINICPGM